MAQRSIEVNGVAWNVSPSGRRTQYAKDEFSVVFARADGSEVRVARYSPLGSKAREASLAELSDARLTTLLARSQPSWTAAEMGYQR
ncbi:MAG: hypothetical protein KF785_10395 [Gemmatimonadales bacterium]|nr:hypothetical protein [Gemmatimonadales bacterium]